MKRILIIDPSTAVKETVALLLEGDYELERLDWPPEGAALKDTVAGAHLVIAGAGAAAWTGELARMAAQGKVSVLFLAGSKSAAGSFAEHDHLSCLVAPFNPYDLKAAVEKLLKRSPLNAATQAGPRAAREAYLDFPFLGQATARLARRFAATSLPILVWGELGCGQDRVTRAILGRPDGSRPLLRLNSVDIGVEYLRSKDSELAAARRATDASPAVLMEGMAQLPPAGQSMLLEFLDEIEETYGRLRLLATANADLLERVYRGEFLERLYHKLAILVLPLAPLRQRRDDLPALARWFAGAYAATLGLGKVSFSQAAMHRLRDYLWFGNVDEFEAVIARTLTIHGRARIDAADIVFDVSSPRDSAFPQKSVEVIERAGEAAEKPPAPQSSLIVMPGLREVTRGKGARGGSADIRLLVHELAHELKNPMVTIKTFAQLLAERYDDASFRARFQNVVDDDIERMDDLLEVMMEYAGFDQPRRIGLALKEHLHSTLEEIHDECAKRQISVGWRGNGQGADIMADKAQLQYALKNTLLAVLSEAKSGSEIELALSKQGSVTISYLREKERVRSLANYFNGGSVTEAENIVPLRMLLAREIVERSGGRIGMDQADGDREVVTMEFSVV